MRLGRAVRNANDCRLCGKALEQPGQEEPPSPFDYADFLPAWKMADYEDDTGLVASPEWFEEDIAHGNF
jgi:hypothetical protein